MTSPAALRRLEAIGLFVGSFAIAAYVVANKHGVDRLLGDVGPFAIPLAILIFAIVAAAPFSVTDALAVSNGVLFGPWIGSAVNAGGLLVAAYLGYKVAERTAAAFDVAAAVERLPTWVHRFRVGSPMFLIVVRLIPGMGGTISTQVAASLRVSMWTQIWTMSLVTIPLCTALAFGGNAVSDYVENSIIRPAERYARRHHIPFPSRSPTVTPTPLVKPTR